MIKMNLIIKIFASLLLGLFLSVSHAQSPLAWEQLTTEEQQILTPYKNDWQQMNVADQYRLKKTAHTWKNMSAEQRAVMQQRAEQWHKMPEATKQKLRARYQQFETMSAEQKQAMIQRMNNFQSLPAQEREALRHRWQQQMQQQDNAGDKQLRHNKDEKVTSSNKIRMKESDTGKQADEMNKPEEPAENSTDSRLENRNRMQNNRLDTQRLNRPMRRTR